MSRNTGLNAQQNGDCGVGCYTEKSNNPQQLAATSLQTGTGCYTGKSSSPQQDPVLRALANVILGNPDRDIVLMACLEYDRRIQLSNGRK